MSADIKVGRYNQDIVLLDGHGSFFTKKRDAPSNLERELSADGPLSPEIKRLLGREDFIHKVKFWEYLHLTPYPGISVLDNWIALSRRLDLPSQTLETIAKQVEEDPNMLKTRWRDKQCQVPLFSRTDSWYFCLN